MDVNVIRGEYPFPNASFYVLLEAHSAGISHQ